MCVYAHVQRCDAPKGELSEKQLFSNFGISFDFSTYTYKVYAYKIHFTLTYLVFKHIILKILLRDQSVVIFQNEKKTRSLFISIFFPFIVVVSLALDLALKRALKDNLMARGWQLADLSMEELQP